MAGESKTETMVAPAALPLGRLGRPHGLRGELVLHLFNPHGVGVESLCLPVPIELVQGERRQHRRLLASRPFQEGSLVCFEGVETREAAAALTGCELHVPRALLPPPEPGETYVEDLVGCAVVDQHGRARGVVQGAFWNGAQDVLTIADDAGAELLVPAVPEFLLEVDLEGRRLVIDDHE
jgi:16S rRNA processing protein RimM